MFMQKFNDACTQSIKFKMTVKPLMLQLTRCCRKAKISNTFMTMMPKMSFYTEIQNGTIAFLKMQPHFTAGCHCFCAALFDQIIGQPVLSYHTPTTITHTHTHTQKHTHTHIDCFKR